MPEAPTPQKPARPIPGPPVIGIEGELDILYDLLQVERERLVVARRIEAERKIVFPETTVIVHDIERLLGKIRDKEKARAGQGAAVATAAKKQVL